MLLLQEATRDLFSPHGFMADPKAFWRKAAELFSGRRPTRLHSLLARLAAAGVLQRVYTQNIDGLERLAGVPAKLTVECHGSASRALCSADRAHPVTTAPSSFLDEMHEQGEAWQAPTCSTCGAPLRPDIVFFGEPLPETFTLLSGKDLKVCDLLIVVGTALSVYPVAGLVQQVAMLTPRLLINSEAVGVWRESIKSDVNYRDVFYQGTCDEGAEHLAQLLEWDLEEVV